MNAEERWEVVIVGAGAAGLMAAISAAERGRRTLLLEKNHRPGVKILISGGTRCNITHAGANRDIVAAFGSQGNFLHSPLAALSVDDTIRLFHDEGVATKVEPTGKVFPVSDRATDVLAALTRRLAASGAHLATEEPLETLECDDHGFGLRTPKRTLEADTVVITTGGVSYPGCGTTGDGYRWAAALGHTIAAPRPALTPITVDTAWIRQLQGVTLPDIRIRVKENSVPPVGGANPAERRPQVLDERRGAMLFTHFGLSGPAILDCSRVVSGHSDPRRLRLQCDLMPDVPGDELEDRLRTEAAREGKRQLAGLVGEMLPRRLADSVLAMLGIDGDRKAAEVGRRDLATVAGAIKSLEIEVTGTRGFKKAEVTAGGVALAEVDSRTMQSKRVERLYLAGEVLDLDGPIGGYNFQAAWSTGWLAGLCV